MLWTTKTSEHERDMSSSKGEDKAWRSDRRRDGNCMYSRKRNTNFGSFFILLSWRLCGCDDDFIGFVCLNLFIACGALPICWRVGMKKKRKTKSPTKREMVGRADFPTSGRPLSQLHRTQGKNTSTKPGVPPEALSLTHSLTPRQNPCQTRSHWPRTRTHHSPPRSPGVAQEALSRERRGRRWLLRRGSGGR